MARRGRINTETALTMLDTSFSGSEFDVLDSDDGDLRRDDESIESCVEERGTVGDDGGSPAVRDDNQLDPDGGPSTSSPDNVDSDREEDGEDQGVEGSTTPKTRKRVRKPRKWKKNVRIRLRNSGKDYTAALGKQVLFCY